MEIVYSIKPEPEYDLSPEGHFASGDEEADKKMVAEIINDYNNGNLWAWCCVVVTASVMISGEVFTGTVSLGACSYKDEEDFKQDGYYPDMCKEARENLEHCLRELEQLGHKAAEVLSLLERQRVAIPARRI